MPIVNLADMANFFEGSNGLRHNRKLPWSVLNGLHGDGWCIASIDYTFIIPNWHPHSTLVEDTPIRLNQIDNRELSGRVEVG
jgi:hypothetical protein